MSCKCEWPNKRWNLASGLCESCRGSIVGPEPLADPCDAEIVRLHGEVERLREVLFLRAKHRDRHRYALDQARADLARANAMRGSCEGCARIDKLAADLAGMTTERNGMLKAINEHTASCFAERDKLRADLAEAQKVVEAVKAYRALYEQQPPPRSYEAAWSMTLLDACLHAVKPGTA